MFPSSPLSSRGFLVGGTRKGRKVRETRMQFLDEAKVKKKKKKRKISTTSSGSRTEESYYRCVWPPPPLLPRSHLLSSLWSEPSVCSCPMLNHVTERVRRHRGAGLRPTTSPNDDKSSAAAMSCVSGAWRENSRGRLRRWRRRLKGESGVSFLTSKTLIARDVECFFFCFFSFLLTTTSTTSAVLRLQALCCVSAVRVEHGAN